MLMLASRSASRKALISGIGIDFATVPATIDERALETRLEGRGPAEIAKALAEAKALAVSALHPDSIVVGADQVLAVEGTLLHKPADMQAARIQLDRLRGRTHCLFSGLALARGGRVLWSGAERADLTMRDFSDDERDRVLELEGSALLGSVGSYRLEGPSIRLFEHIDGDYSTILGLPLLPLLEALRRHAPEVF
jgi:septum formation protein